MSIRNNIAPSREQVVSKVKLTLLKVIQVPRCVSPCKAVSWQIVLRFTNITTTHLHETDWLAWTLCWPKWPPTAWSRRGPPLTRSGCCGFPTRTSAPSRPLWRRYTMFVLTLKPHLMQNFENQEFTILYLDTFSFYVSVLTLFSRLMLDWGLWCDERAQNKILDCDNLLFSLIRNLKNSGSSNPPDLCLYFLLKKSPTYPPRPSLKRIHFCPQHILLGRRVYFSNP